MSYVPLGSVIGPLSTVALGPLGLFSLATCKGRCEWNHPFNRTRQQECKDECEANTAARRSAREDPAGSGLPPDPAPTSSVPIIIGVAAAAAAVWYFLIRKKATP